MIKACVNLSLGIICIHNNYYLTVMCTHNIHNITISEVDLPTSNTEVGCSSVEPGRTTWLRPLLPRPLQPPPQLAAPSVHKCKFSVFKHTLF